MVNTPLLSARSYYNCFCFVLL